MNACDALLQLYEARIGREIAVGPWVPIDQERIDRFAEITGDVQWIHVDPERAGRESPLGTTIAHGFLTLSLLPWLTGSNRPEYFAEHYPGMSRRLNYGLNRVRFPAPVPAGARIRARTRVEQVHAVGAGIEIVYLFTIEVEGQEKPACLAEQIFRLYP
ncbi:MaoC family dehydratase [Geoalkalibacter halelectricus]|uniref:MaoC family dehydratase n=1 Tax=Geoalkalibacter halelectricus TaxID=2847045 RepID=A0ABY5ZIB0_9BACT|nr:MaoC family dehydratase [Geoalkalibacter halelectricus]MDO3379043.1 MaoC family dehydratase [Geoalkalibacter halelectricus]UWZ78856.1 MaoC family dehydratase [Geoalkalibacter halelectricus]